jgi:hypothetical protein
MFSGVDPENETEEVVVCSGDSWDGPFHSCTHGVVWLYVHVCTFSTGNITINHSSSR